MVDDGDEAGRWRSFGETIRHARERKGLHRTDVAEKAGLSASTLKTIEDGGRNYRGQWTYPSPSNMTVVRIAAALGVPFVDLFAILGREPPTAVFATGSGDDRDYVIVDEPAAFTDKFARLSPGQREAIERLVDEMLGDDR